VVKIDFICPYIIKFDITFKHPMETSHTFKCILVGDTGVGKTTFINRHHTGEFVETHIPTTGVAMTSLTFDTNQGKVDFDVWDVGQNQTKVGQADCAIIMFDLTQASTYTHVPTWYQGIVSQYGPIPIVLVGNKYDVNHVAIKSRQITFHRTANILYYNLSSKSNHHFEKPFLALARQLLNSSNIMFKEENVTCKK
jgi:GTP-binding nuclear protein Ran